MINGKHEYRGDRIGRGLRATTKLYAGIKVNYYELDRAFEKLSREKIKLDKQQ